MLVLGQRVQQEAAAVGLFQVGLGVALEIWAVPLRTTTPLPRSLNTWATVRSYRTRSCGDDRCYLMRAGAYSSYCALRLEARLRSSDGSPSEMKR